MASEDNLRAPTPPNDSPPSYGIGTLSIHADDHLNSATDVAPAMHVSTTFRYNDDPETLQPVYEEAGGKGITSLPPIYSRLSSPNTTRLEALLSSLLHGHALTYSSGLASFHALLVYFRPNVIAIGEGYHGCHGIVDIHKKLHNLKKVDLFDESAWDAAGLGKGDIVHLETPLNPTGEAYDIQKFADMAHRRGAYLSVDATFGPPGLQDPFLQGADVVMHSGTKYFGGHSDMLCGVLAVKNEEWWKGLWGERLLLGSVLGSLEGWLGVRSLRTLELRVQRQSSSATKLVQWLDSAMKEDNGDANVKKAVLRVQHASLQPQEEWLKIQMPNGYGPVFAIWMRSKEAARRLPSKLSLFHHATSLGGVESLIEWRKMSDPTVDERILRVSVGVEDWEDLRSDLGQAFKALVEEGRVE